MKANYKIFKEIGKSYIDQLNLELKLNYLLTDIIYNCEYKNNSYITKGIQQHTKIGEYHLLQQAQYKHSRILVSI